MVQQVQSIQKISSAFDVTCDFAQVVRSENYLVKIGKCENTVQLARFFYKKIVGEVKKKFGLNPNKLIRSDAYALCRLLTELGFRLTPTYAFVFVDEAQDISPCEYEVLRTVNDKAKFNVFGDLKQNVTPFRGIGDWSSLPFETYELDLNYRNTNQIVSHVREKLNVRMRAIGLGGEEVELIPPRQVSSYLSDSAGLKAVITSESNLAEYARKSYNLVRESGRISKTKINLLTVYESKGLEFTAVAVVDSDMTDNEKYIAYTRALKRLAIVRNKK